MSRPIPSEALDITAKWEGFRATAYFCPANVATIGYGHTRTVRPADVGHKTISEAEGRDLLAQDMVSAQNALLAAIGAEHVERLHDKQYAALLSFVFNVGAASDWTIWKKIKAHDDVAVPAQLARFVNAGGRRLEGLVRRRADEATLWRAGSIQTTEDPITDAPDDRPQVSPPRPIPSEPMNAPPAERRTRPKATSAFAAFISAIIQLLFSGRKTR